VAPGDPQAEGVDVEPPTPEDVDRFLRIHQRDLSIILEEASDAGD
jgi:hypothetical protein